MTIFRPCIDIDEGQVTVRSYLYSGTGLLEPHGAPQDRDLKSAGYYANIFKEHGLSGGHVFKHSHGCDDAALEALRAWPGNFMIGGSITLANAQSWLDAGASKVILRNELYPEGNYDEDILRRISEKVGTEQVVVDVTCRKKGFENYWIALNRWTSFTSQQVTEDSIMNLSSFCSELLFHPANESGKQSGVDQDFIEMVTPWTRVPSTYAGGCRIKQDLVLVERASDQLMDITFGSALDLYGGDGVKLADLVKWNKEVIAGSHAKKTDAYHRPSLSGDELEAEFRKFAASMPEGNGGLNRLAQLHCVI
jgi:phosphoribosylformimino-5-aminoimidazole carboxamide ribotide isomerase